MNYKKIKGTNINASTIILGTNYFGTDVSKEMAFKMMDEYVENGGNVLDTARMYADWLPNGAGASERTIGQYINERNIRGKIIISTKASHPKNGISRLSPAEIESDIDDSLSTLKTDYIDILWLHRDDTSLEVEEIMNTLDRVVKKGKILSYGASNWTGERMGKANEYALKQGLMPFVASQIQWSLATCNELEDKTLVQMDDNEYDFYKQTKMPVFAYSPQAKGFFEKYDKNCLSQKAKERYLNDENANMYEYLKKLSGETGYSLSALALSYLTMQADFDTFPIIGCSNLQQLSDSLTASKIERNLF